MADSRKKLFLTLGVLIFSIALFAFLTRIFLYSVLKAEQDSYIKNREEIYSIQKTIEFKNDLVADIEEKKEEIDRVESIFLKEAEKGAFIAGLSSMAQGAGVNYEIKSAREVNKGEKLDRIDFDISITGEFANTMAFLDELNSLPYFIDISSMNIKALSETSKTLDSSLSFKVFVY